MKKIINQRHFFQPASLCFFPPIVNDFKLPILACFSLSFGEKADELLQLGENINTF
jgi:hypothetical protein